MNNDTLIDDTDLSIRTKRLFKNAKILTVDNLLEIGISDLIKYKGFGKQSLSEIRGFVIRHNLSFYN